MKGLQWYDKVLFFLNSLFAALLLFSYLLPYIPPETFALLSVFSLILPLFIAINFFFLVYWLFRLKKQVLVSLIVLLMGFNHLTSIYEISGSKEIEPGTKTLKVLSYNVRQFNEYEWSEQKDIPLKISGFIKEEDPDIVAMQEYYKGELNIAASFPYKYIKLKEENAEFGLSIFSKYPIINSGSLNFHTASNNNAIYADIVVWEDTLRVINVHLQSFQMKPNIDNMETERSKKVFLGMGRTFVMQQNQMQMVLDVIRETPYKVIVMGDFNNTAYSYIYRELKSKGFNDTYKQAGNGFGQTFDVNYFPLRIDYIMPEESIEVISFETYQVPFSDHFPIMAELVL